MHFAQTVDLASTAVGYRLGTDLISPIDPRFLNFKRACIVKLQAAVGANPVNVVNNTAPAAGDIGFVLTDVVLFEITLSGGTSVGLDDIIVSPATNGNDVRIWVTTL